MSEEDQGQCCQPLLDEERREIGHKVEGGSKEIQRFYLGKERVGHVFLKEDRKKVEVIGRKDNCQNKITE